MSDSGESGAGGRLSDVEEIAAALRAGELDPITRFGQRRDEQATAEQTGKTPDEILEGLRSDDRDCDEQKIVTSTGIEICPEVAAEWLRDVAWSVGDTIAEVTQSFGIDPRVSASAIAYELLDRRSPSPDEPLVILVKIEEDVEDHLFVLQPKQDSCGGNEFVLVELGETRKLGAVGLENEQTKREFGKRKSVWET